MYSQSKMNENLENRDPKTWGKAFWTVIYQIIEAYPHSNVGNELKQKTASFFDSLTMLLPCEKCRLHYREYMAKYPLPLENKKDLEQWAQRLENAIKVRNAAGTISIPAAISQFVTSPANQKPRISAPRSHQPPHRVPVATQQFRTAMQPSMRRPVPVVPQRIAVAPRFVVQPVASVPIQQSQPQSTYQKVISKQVARPSAVPIQRKKGCNCSKKVAPHAHN